MNGGKPIYFDLELRPNRSMQRRHFWLMIAAVAAVFLLMGLRFLFLGAWPIIPFMLIDIGLLVWAMRESYRSGLARERLRLDSTGLELLRIAPHGARRSILIEPWLARIELEELGEQENRLWLTSGGRREPVGQFLSPEERVEIAAVIREGLARWRRG